MYAMAKAAMKKVPLLLLLLLVLVLRGEGGATVKGENENEDGLVSAFVQPQNAARAQVGEAPLVWDERVAAYAEAYAEQRRSDCELRHSEGPYGENIFWGGGSAWTPADAVATWVGEDRLFNYHSHSCNGYQECGHYTQIIWKSSLRVGCARVICRSGDTFMTCNYDPPGNYIGEKPY